ncbi:MAG: hypothetical protein L3J67_02065 [Hyphomicrobiaceae bacterium]|nr:hypothetical protein [Hyphomicrobiaceae bacterium]
MINRSVYRPVSCGLLALGAFAVVFAAADPAEAKIRCQGPFQIIKGVGSHATPYCEDNYLARIARSYGWKIANRSVRNNPSLKARICRQIGHDSRLIEICSDHRNGSGEDSAGN